MSEGKKGPTRPNSQGIDYDELAEREPPELYHVSYATDTSEDYENPDDFEEEAFMRDESDGYFFNCRRGDELEDDE